MLKYLFIIVVKIKNTSRKIIILNVNIFKLV